MNLKDGLKKLLKEKDLTLAALAKRTGIPRKTLDGWSAGKNPQSLDDLQKVSSFLGVSIEELCGFILPKSQGKHIPSNGELNAEFIKAGLYEIYLRPYKHNREDK